MLDTAGFQFYKRTAKVTTFTDDVQMEKEYYPERVELIKELTGEAG